MRVLYRVFYRVCCILNMSLWAGLTSYGNTLSNPFSHYWLVALVILSYCCGIYCGWVSVEK